MITTWYHPSWCGDYRVEADGPSKSLLTVVDPTPAEVDKLIKLLEQFKKKKWISPLAGISAGENKLEILAPIVEVGALVLGSGVRTRPGLLTAIAVSSGEVKAIDGNGESVIEAVASSDAEAAVTTPRPTSCCPKPTPGREQRASEVLRRFSTQKQWKSWQEHGYMHCHGGLSGRLYRLAHRRTALAQAQGKVAYDVYGGYAVHCHCSQLPPAEEVLAIKHALEYRENWVRNRSTVFGVRGGRSRDVYYNPFVGENEQASDGLADTAITGFISGTLRGLMAFGPPKSR